MKNIMIENTFFIESQMFEKLADSILNEQIFTSCQNSHAKSFKLPLTVLITLSARAKIIFNQLKVSDIKI